MFVRNGTPLPVCLKRMSMPEDLRVAPRSPFEPPPTDRKELHFATLTSVECYRLESGRWAATPATVPDELRSAFECGLTHGASVTVSGHVQGSSKGQLATRVRATVHQSTVELVCRGPRSWRRMADGSFVTTPLSSFDPFPLDWSLAFGGTVRVPAGIDEFSRLPRPAFEARHPLNPLGRGHIVEHARAEGVELPRIELLGDQVRTPEDQPIPGGLGICPPSAALRWVMTPDPRMQLGRESHRSPFFPLHVAPFYLVFDELSPGTAVTLEGMRAGNLTFTIPPPRAVVSWRGAPPSKTGTRLRTLHLDADAGVATLLVQHAIVLPGTKFPRDVVISERPS